MDQDGSLAEQSSPAAPEAPTTQTAEDRRRAAVAAGAGAVVLVIGSLGPWVTALGGIVSANGTSGDGTYFVLAALVAAGLVGWAMATSRRGPVTAAAIISAMVVFAAVYDLIAQYDRVSGVESAGVAWGIWVAVLGATGLTAATVWLRHLFDAEGSGVPREPRAGLLAPGSWSDRAQIVAAIAIIVVVVGVLGLVAAA